MVGEPLDLVEAGVHTMISGLKRNPYALETVHMSIIGFDAKARVIMPLTEVNKVRPPVLSIRPGTALGAAMDLLAQSIGSDLVKSTKESKGDYRPLVFILTDGQPTDDWAEAVNRIRGIKPQVANIYAIGCGGDVDFETLAKIGDVCIHVKDMNTESIGKLFVWLTASVQSNSMAPDEPVNLAKAIPMEPGMEIVDKPPKFTDQKSRLFVHVTCRKTRKPYMIVYRRSPHGGDYHSQMTVPLPADFFSDGARKSSPINEQDLNDIPPCPFCQSDGFGKCGFCHHLFCIDEESAEEPFLVCPVCETRLTASDSGAAFSFDGSVG
jgi:uncharacterized protein YegL